MDRHARSLVDLKQIVDEITVKGASVEFVHERVTCAAGAQDQRADLMLSLLGPSPGSRGPSSGNAKPRVSPSPKRRVSKRGANVS